MSSSKYIESSQYKSYEDRVTIVHDADKFNPDIHCNLISFLSSIQRSKIDFLAVKWNALDSFSKGATADVHQSTLDTELQFAYKRTTRLFMEGQTKAFRTLMPEIYLLGTPTIRNHPNIVDLEGICWEIDEHENLCPVFVFQKAQNGDLGRYLRSGEGRESLFDTRRNLCLDIGKAISVLHSGNIVHGDIKPQNILVFRDKDGDLTAKMTDFGYSCIGSTEEDSVRLPRSWPWYAPERELNSYFTLGDAKKTDVYSFGMVCLYTLFWDHFMEDSASSTSQGSEAKLNAWKVSSSEITSKIDELLNKVVGLSDTLKSSLQEFFQTTLTDDSDSRITNFKTLMNYLEGLSSANDYPLEPLPVLDLGAPFHADFRVAESVLDLCYFDFRVRRMIMLALEATASASGSTDMQSCTTCRLKSAFNLAFCYSLGFGVEANGLETSHWLRISGEDTDALERETELARKKTRINYTGKTLEKLRSNRIINSLSLSVQYLKQTSLEDIVSCYEREISDFQASLGITHAAILVLKSVLSGTYTRYGDFGKAEKANKELIEIMSETLHPEASDTLSSMANLASTYWSQGRWKEAEMLEAQVLRTRKTVLGQEHPDTLASMTNFASVCARRGRFRDAEMLLETAMATNLEIFGQDHPDTLTSTANLARTYDMQGRWREAAALDTQIIESRKKILGDDHPETLTSMVNLGSTYRHQGLLKEAEDLETQVIEMRKKVLGEEHPDTLIGITCLASTYYNQGRYSEAEQLELQVMETRKRVLGLGDEHSDTLTSKSNLAAIYLKQGLWKKAQELYLVTIEIKRRVLGEEHPSTLLSTENLSSVYRNQGQWNKAEELGLQVMEAKKRILGEQHPDTIVSMGNLASTYRNQGRLKEAEKLEVQIAGAHPNLTDVGQDNPVTLASMANSAATYWMQGRWDKAEELFLGAVKASSKIYGETHQNTLTYMANLASTYRSQRRLKAAEDLELDVLEKTSLVLGPNHPDTIASMGNLGSTYLKQGMWKESQEFLERAIEAASVSEGLGREHPDTLAFMGNLTGAYRGQGKLKEAEELGVQVLETTSKLLGWEHPDTVASMASLADTYKVQNQIERAIAMVTQVTTLSSRVLGNDHPYTKLSREKLEEWKEEIEAV